MTTENRFIKPRVMLVCRHEDKHGFTVQVNDSEVCAVRAFSKTSVRFYEKGGACRATISTAGQWQDKNLLVKTIIDLVELRVVKADKSLVGVWLTDCERDRLTTMILHVCQKAENDLAQTEMTTLTDKTRFKYPFYYDHGFKSICNL